jgi:hypothetical protein
MEKEKDIKRFPRPLGLTAMMKEYNDTKDPSLLSKAQDYLINQWLMGNGVICGVMYDINLLSQKLGLDINYIRMYMRDRLLNSKIWDKDRQEEMVTGLLGEQLAWAMEDRMEVSHQVQVLREAQGGKYTPFISAELNKALKLKLDSSNSLQTIVRNLIGGSTTNIFQQFNQQNIQAADSQFISVDEARELIQEQQQVLPKSEEAKLLEAKYDIHSLPEVVATKQEGVDTTKEGLSLNKTELNMITDDYKGAMASSSREHHEMRREIEQNIDPDEPDPELDIYYTEYEEEDEDNNISEQFLRK